MGAGGTEIWRKGVNRGGKKKTNGSIVMRMPLSLDLHNGGEQRLGRVWETK